LENTKPTGTIYFIDKNMLHIRDKAGNTHTEGIPAFLSNPKLREEVAKERYCDRTAMLLSQLVLGVPLYHPLQKDAEKTLKTMKETLDRYDSSFEQMPLPLRKALGIGSGPAFFPMLKPLGRPADVKDILEG